MKPPTRSATERVLPLGEQMALAVAERDSARLRSLFGTPVVFRAVTPRRFWDAETPVGVDDLLLGTWFGADKAITGLAVLDSDTVGDVQKVSYRMTVELSSGPAVVEQVAYYSTTDGLITDMRLVCSGFRPA